MTTKNHPNQTDLEEAIEKEKKAARRAEPKFSTSVLLPPKLKAMKNGDLVKRIEFWLEHVDTKKLIEKTLQYALERIQDHRKGLEKDPNSYLAIWTGFQSLAFKAECYMRSGSREEMKEFKKTITLPQSIHDQLIDAATDLGVSFGEMVRIAVTHSYLIEDEDTGEYSIFPELGKPFSGTGKVADHTEYRCQIHRQRLDAKIEADRTLKAMAGQT